MRSSSDMGAAPERTRRADRSIVCNGSAGRLQLTIGSHRRAPRTAEEGRSRARLKDKTQPQTTLRIVGARSLNEAAPNNRAPATGKSLGVGCHARVPVCVATDRLPTAGPPLG